MPNPGEHESMLLAFETGAERCALCCLCTHAAMQEDLEEIDQAVHRSLAVALPSMSEAEMRGAYGLV